jgi:putative acetyltransferase
VAQGVAPDPGAGPGGLTVRPEGGADAAAIGRVMRAAFPGGGEALLVDRLREAGALTVSLVAVGADGAVVGHVALSPLALKGGGAPEGSPWLGLAPVAVVSERQRRGIGAALVRAALAAADGRGAGLVAVLGEPAYYGRFGFAPAARHGLRLPWDVPAEAFMVRLGPKGAAGLPEGGGVVRYHPAFDALV